MKTKWVRCQSKRVRTQNCKSFDVVFLGIDEKHKNKKPIKTDEVPKAWPKFVLDKKDHQLYYQDRSTPVAVVPIYLPRNISSEDDDEGEEEEWSYDDERNKKSGQIEANQRGSHVYYAPPEQRVLWDDDIKGKSRKEWLDELGFVYVDASQLKEIPLDQVNHMMGFAAYHKDVARDLRIHYGTAVRNGDYQDERIVLV
jgi:hypothetical protein